MFTELPPNCSSIHKLTTTETLNSLEAQSYSLLKLNEKVISCHSSINPRASWRCPEPSTTAGWTWAPWYRKQQFLPCTAPVLPRYPATTVPQPAAPVWVRKLQVQHKHVKAAWAWHWQPRRATSWLKILGEGSTEVMGKQRSGENGSENEQQERGMRGRGWTFRKTSDMKESRLLIFELCTPERQSILNYPWMI